MKKDNYKKLRAFDQIIFFLFLQFYKNKSNKKKWVICLQIIKKRS